jgi:hypothetical protein
MMTVCRGNMGCLTEGYSRRSALCIVGAVRLAAVHQSQSKSYADADIPSQTIDMMAKICDS